ncbi:hypothetical protein AAMO2058_001448200 [Amorphochlora amoebiformis]
MSSPLREEEEGGTFVSSVPIILSGRSGNSSARGLEYMDELYDENPFFKQGDPSMYTLENIQRRKALKNEPKIKLGIEKFWKLLEIDSNNRLTKRGYKDLMIRICKVLRPSFDQESALEEIDVDFERDAKGASSLSYSFFYDSMFELVDLWTVDVEPEEYQNFLDNIFVRMTIQRKTNIRTGETTQHRPISQLQLSNIETKPEPTEPEKEEEGKEQEPETNKEPELQPEKMTPSLLTTH